jgi:hypothetical protein
MRVRTFTGDKRSAAVISGDRFLPLFRAAAAILTEEAGKMNDAMRILCLFAAWVGPAALAGREAAEIKDVEIPIE